MKRAIVLACAALGAVACTPPAAPANVAPARVAPPKIAVAAVPETPDDGFRYRAPAIGPETPKPLEIAEIKIPNGLSAVLVEDHTSPLVTVDVVVTRREGSDVARDQLLRALFLAAKSPTGHALYDDLAQLGAQSERHAGVEGVGVSFAVLTEDLSAALAKVFGALRNARFEQTELDTLRKLLASNAQLRDASSLVGLVRDKRVLLDGDPFRATALIDAAALQKLTLADVAKHREISWAPDLVHVCVAGDVERAGLTSMLERVAGDWPTPALKAVVKPVAKPVAKAVKGAADKAVEGPAMSIARGVFLLERADKTVTFLLNVPLPAPGRPDYAAAMIAWSAFHDRAAAAIEARVPGVWSSIDGSLLLRHGTNLLQLKASAPAGRAAEALAAALETLDTLAKQGATAQQILVARRHSVTGAADRGRAKQLVAFLASSVSSAVPMDLAAGLPAALRATTDADVQRALATYFRRDRAAVVAVGPVLREKETFGMLDVGPVTIEPDTAKAPPAKAASPDKEGGSR